MKTATKIAPPNSLLVVSDLHGGIPPAVTRGPRLWWTPSCIMIGCLSFMDGETEVSLGRQEPHGATRPAFDGILDTPSKMVVVSTVEWTPILSTSVESTKTRVRIWTNHPTEPDDVWIAVGLTVGET